MAPSTPENPIIETDEKPETLSREEADRILATVKAVREDKKKAEMELKTLKERLAAFGEVTPEQLEELKAAREAESKKREAEIANYRELKAQTEAEKAKLLAEIEAAKNAQAATVLRHSAESEFLAAGGRSDKSALGSGFEILWPRIQSRLAIIDGQLQVVTSDGYPDPKYEKPSDLFEELSKDPLASAFFSPIGATGSGARSSRKSTINQREAIRNYKGSERLAQARKLQQGG